MATLSLHNYDIEVYTSMIPDNIFKNGSFYQVFGELVHSRSGDIMSLSLRARVAMNVDGIDIPLFEQALQLRRKYEADRGVPQTALGHHATGMV